MNQVKSFFSGADPARDASSISSSSELNKQQRERLHRRFDRLTRNTGLLTLADLSALPELHSNPFVPMIYAFLCREAGKTTKAKGNEALSVVEFGRALESLKAPCTGSGGGGGGGDGGAAGSDDSLAAAVFRVLDSDGDGRLSLGELEAALRPVLRASSGEEKHESSSSSGAGGGGGVPAALAAGAILQKHDADGDGGLSLPEFRSLLAAAGVK